MADIFDIWRRPADRRTRPLIIAHRGASTYAPDNTVAAFYAATDAGADAVEMDIVLTHDRVPICRHDSTILLPGGGRRAIGRLDYTTAKEFIPTAPTLSEACKAGLPILLDIKETSLADILTVLSVPDIANASGRFIVGVHSVSSFEVIRQSHPHILQVAMINDDAALGSFTDQMPGHWIRLHERDVNPSKISGFQRAGMQVMVTCGGCERQIGDAGPHHIRELALANADALIVNDPALAIEVLARARGGEVG